MPMPCGNRVHAHCDGEKHDLFPLVQSSLAVVAVEELRCAREPCQAERDAGNSRRIRIPARMSDRQLRVSTRYCCLMMSLPHPASECSLALHLHMMMRLHGTAICDTQSVGAKPRIPLNSGLL